MKRFLVTLTLPDDADPSDVALWVDVDIARRYGCDTDATAYATEGDYLDDLRDWGASNEWGAS